MQKLSEEIANSILHGIGALLSIVGLIALVLKSRNNPNLNIIGVIIYGTSLFLLYITSTLYHSLKQNKAKRVFERLDHCAIYLLIAGTYTAIILSTLHSIPAVIVLILIWILAILGIVLKSIFGDKKEKISTGTYLIMGWLIIFVFNELIVIIPKESLILIVLGGLAYTLGTVFFSIKNIKYSHAVWHVLVLAGSIFHFFGVYYL